MPLTELRFQPGIKREGTALSTKGAWFASDKVRFRNGLPEKIGGWQTYSLQLFVGACRFLYNWFTLSGNDYCAVGTSQKFYIEQGGALNDVTPLKGASAVLVNCFSTVNLSSTVTLTTTLPHGLLVGDWFDIAGVTGGPYNGITAAQLNGSWQVVTAPTPTTLTFVSGGTANATSGGVGGGSVSVSNLREVMAPNNPFTTVISSNIVAVECSNTTGVNVGDWVDISGVAGGPYNGLTAAQLNGGFTVYQVNTVTNFSIKVSSNASASGVLATGAVTIQFELPVGLDVEASGTGWGTGGWGVAGWGYGVAGGVTGSIRLWDADAFGQDLLANVVGGGIYYFSANSGLTARMVALTNYSADPNCPIVANCVLVTPYRHAVVFGTNPLGTTSQDPMFVRWSDQENLSGGTSWTATLTNQAGGYRLTDGSGIIAAHKTKQETLIWTNSALYSMQFSGAPYIYSFYQVGVNISVASVNAMVTVSGTTTYWMGNDKFYVYNGSTTTLPCDVRKLVFDTINPLQMQQVFAFTNERFNEVWWLYPSLSNLNGNNTNDCYVCYNYVDNAWTYGTMPRTAWLDSPLRTYPMAAVNLPAWGGGKLFWHEYGTDDGSTASPVPITAYIESSDLDMMDGEKFALLQRIVPDVSFMGSTITNPQCNLSIYARRNSGSTYSGPNEFSSGTVATVSSTAVTPFAQQTVPVDQFTQDAWIRIRGRQFKLRIDSTTLGVQWQLGTPLVRVQADGRR